MIDVNVTDAIYCSMGICQALDWWSAAAAWAQAVLTVATFAGTVVYQARQTSDRERQATLRETKESNERRRRDIALARVFAARELRRWRRAIRTHLGMSFNNTEDEVTHGMETLRQINWARDPQELTLLGTFAEDLVDLIATADDVADAMEHGDPSKNAEGSLVTAEEVRNLWGAFETSITKLLKTMEGAQKRLA